MSGREDPFKKCLDSSSGKLVSGLQEGVEALPKAMHPSSAGRAGLLISEIKPKRVQSWRELWGDAGDIPLIVPKNCQQNPTTTLNQNIGKVTMRKALLRVSSHNGDSCGPVRLQKGNGLFWLQLQGPQARKAWTMPLWILLLGTIPERSLGVAKGCWS